MVCQMEWQVPKYKANKRDGKYINWPKHTIQSYYQRICIIINYECNYSMHACIRMIWIATTVLKLYVLYIICTLRGQIKGFNISMFENGSYRTVVGYIVIEHSTL